MKKGLTQGRSVRSWGWQFGRKVVVPIVTVTFIAVLIACAGLYWTTRQADLVSVERQVRATRHAIDVSVAELAREQYTIAAWDEHVLELRKAQPDWQWIDENVAVWLHDLFGHDEVYLLDPADRPVHSVVEGARVEPGAYRRVADDVRLLVDVVRGRARDRTHALIGHGSEHAIQSRHATRLQLVRGRPAATSVMQIIPLTGKVARWPGREHLLVSVRFLDGTFLTDLSDRNLIAEPRYSRVADARPGEQALPLESEPGRTIGYFIWRPELPGSRLLRDLAPVTALTVALLVLAMAFLGWRLWRSLGALQRTYWRLKGMVIELKASEAQAHHLAFHDVLTGLPNRALFSDRLEQALSRARRGGRIALLALDLDRFKQVNDTLGHHAGDALIREFGARVSGLLREQDTVARLSGDEFAVIIEDPERAEVVAVCQRILEAVRQPFDLGGANAFVGVSIGVVHAPQAGTDRVDLLRKADIALYRAKKEGRDCWREFTDEMDATVRRRRAIEEDLRAALASGEGLCLHYQPQVAGPWQQVVGLEALIRWDHQTRGCMSPEQFIPIAEETGLIGEVGEWLLKEACATATRFPQLFMAVNLSPVQFRSAGFAERVIAIVRESGAEPRRIELEVTENVLLDDDEQVVEALRTLRAAGLRIALDDFGTGYSSLSYLRRFEVDKIKIDKSFVQHLGHSVDSAAIVTAIVTLGHAMGLTVTAEGVETAEQQQFLAASGCNLLQGFLYSRAVPGHRLAAVVEQARERLVA